jgi:hypothetical protein
MVQIVQSIIIPKSTFSKIQAINWVKKNYHYYKIDITTNEFRFRQADPNQLKQKYPNGHYFMKTLPNKIHLVIFSTS